MLIKPDKSYYDRNINYTGILNYITIYVYTYKRLRKCKIKFLKLKTFLSRLKIFISYSYHMSKYSILITTVISIL